MLKTSRPTSQNLIDAFSTRKNDFDFSFLYTTSVLSAKEVTCDIKLQTYQSCECQETEDSLPVCNMPGEFSIPSM